MRPPSYQSSSNGSLPREWPRFVASNDSDMLRDGLVLYDALYLWAREAMQETHTWNPNLYLPQGSPPERHDPTFAEPFDSGRASGSSRSADRPDRSPSSTGKSSRNEAG